MGSRLMAAVLLLLALSLGPQAGAANLGTCETSVGVWEFATTSGGRLLITREGPGSKYDVVWVAKFTNSDTGDVEPEGVAAECTCANAATRLVWKCQVVFSLQYVRIGSHQTYEWSSDGDTLKSWYVAPDGKRNEGVPIRRPR